MSLSIRFAAWRSSSPSPSPLAAAVTAPSLLSAQGASRGREVPAAIAAIRQADLERDLHAMASDAMRGREGGTIDELRASLWVAEMYKKIGLAPMGDEGTYFQWFNMTRTRVSTTASRIAIGGTAAGPLPRHHPVRRGTERSDGRGAVAGGCARLHGGRAREDRGDARARSRSLDHPSDELPGLGALRGRGGWRDDAGARAARRSGDRAGRRREERRHLRRLRHHARARELRRGRCGPALRRTAAPRPAAPRVRRGTDAGVPGPRVDGRDAHAGAGGLASRCASSASSRPR